MTADLLDEVRAEIERMHNFLAGWFDGSIPQGDFEYGIATLLHPEFENVQPSGRALTRDELLDGLREAWGTNREFRIEISETRILGVWPECGLILAEYVEAQFGALNTKPANNLRRSTVVFERGTSGLVWRHIHETALPA